MSQVVLKNSKLNGSVVIPPSKSVAHRALFCSALAGGNGKVSPIIDSNDMKATLGVVKQLTSGKEMAVLDCIESGSTLRFAIPVAAALGINATFFGSGRLPERPIGEFLELLPKHNVKCDSDGMLPLTISGKLTSGDFEIAGNTSSQYITGLFMALPILCGDSKIILTTPLQSKPYVDMTIEVMKDFGVEVTETEYGYFVKGNQKYNDIDYNVESDWSQASFFMSAGAIGAEIELNGLNINSTQGDKEVVELMKAFGADVKIEKSIICKNSELNGIEINATNIPDMVPSLAVTAAFAKGKTVITGAQRLRLKESDRIESIVYNLKQLGADIVETDDGMIINGGKPLHCGNLKGFNDHRIVMAFAIACAFIEGESTIDDCESINKSYPNFFKDYNRLGGKANVVNIW